MIIIIIIFILIILYLYSKYVTKNPITMLYLKIRKQKNENHTSTPENSTVNIETTQNPLPTLYPAVSA
jgi:cell division protein FtsL